MYFQYSGDELIGFCLNDAQYFYIKNPNGDIVGIADYDGNLIAEYEYDEWGKLLNITTAEEGNEEQLKIATANPFRYRGYYYDNETGYYYLHSRYYNPEWGRFISADDLNYVHTFYNTGINIYCYCRNNPIIYTDYNGKYPKLSEVPPASSGYQPPKNGPVKEKVPKGSYKNQWGWKDKSGRYWVPDKSDHGGEHWDVVSKDGNSHENIYRDGHKRGDNDDHFNGSSGGSALGNGFSVELFAPTEDIALVIVIVFIFVILFPVFIAILPFLFPAFA